MLRKLLLITATVISAFALHTAEMNINDRDLELGVKFDMGQFDDGIEPGTIFFGGKILNGQQENRKVENGSSWTDFDRYLEVNFLMKRVVGTMGLSVGMGVKLNYTQGFSSLPLGLEFDYTILTKELVPMFVNGSVYYAPGSLSFLDAKDFLEYRMSFDIEMIENGRVTIGYRNINTNYKTAIGNVVYNDSFYAGFKFAF
ncbi:MAG TPA: hypothetical protein EYO75_03505 [Sulfurimonas sp.]|nr:hypothetical protein [Sulfurimonas sp.]HIM76172.1 hypothetical protein [Campylobacterales bacterium]